MLFTINHDLIKEKSPLFENKGLKLNWRRPTLPQITCSTIGAIELNFRVRDGNGCNLNAIITRSVI